MMQYNVHTLTMEQLRDLIRSGDDSKQNQIRIKEDGTIFLSQIVDGDCLDGIVGRFETFQPNNHYVGPESAKDDKYIRRLFLTIQHWIECPCPYIDVWVNI